MQYLSTCTGESGQKFELKFEIKSKFEAATACSAVDHVNFLEGRSRNCKKLTLNKLKIVGTRC